VYASQLAVLSGRAELLARWRETCLIDHRRAGDECRRSHRGHVLGICAHSCGTAGNPALDEISSHGVGILSGAVELVCGRMCRFTPAALGAVDLEEFLSVIGPQLAFADQLRATTTSRVLDPLDLASRARAASRRGRVSDRWGASISRGRVKPRWVEATLRVRQPQGNVAGRE